MEIVGHLTRHCEVLNEPRQSSFNLKPRHAHFVTLKLADITDTAIVVFFPAPKSFTGEDVVEIQAHGGELLLQKIVDAAITHGARLAEPGEFTRRAIENGKMTLTDAEGLLGIINAECDAELAAASVLKGGELGTKMMEVESGLVDISAQIEAALDHPEDVTLDKSIFKRLRAFMETLDTFVENGKTTAYIFRGINVAILGEPNAGKSSLFNKLIGLDRSIVTEIAGTTTDCVSETITFAGFKIRLVDTAGIRDAAGGKIEKLGIERTIKAARDCDIALVFDTTGAKLAKELNKPIINVTRTSTPDKIKAEIIRLTVGDARISSRPIASVRQLNELNAAHEALKFCLTGGTVTSIDNTSADREPDLVASGIQTALHHIGRITGTNSTEAVLDAIFSKFCLGK